MTQAALLSQGSTAAPDSFATQVPHCPITAAQPAAWGLVSSSAVGAAAAAAAAVAAASALHAGLCCFQAAF